jgi:MinD superfamily P-loop ATPase
MKELVVISGKGGTGKTSVVAALATLAGRCVLADCDVDAADLHLVLSPTIQRRTEFRSGHEAVIREDECIRCGACLAHCRFEAVRTDGGDAGEARFWIDPLSCEGCGVCVRFCPSKAIDFPERTCGQWYVSTTRFGPMVHARLGIAAENSGKLVNLVRREARWIAEEQARNLVLVDGPPGIGCPVIASITGASLVLIVTEPTLSGLHDLERVAALARHFDIAGRICVNKWDLNPEMTQRIEQWADVHGLPVAGRLRYDLQVTRAQIHRQSVVEYATDGVAADVRQLWTNISAMLVQPAA